MHVLVLTPDSDSISGLQAISAELEITVESSLSRGLGRLGDAAWDLVVLDTAFHEDLTTELVERISGAGHRVVVLARTLSLGLVAEAMRRGATEVLQHPLDPTRFANLLSRLERSASANSSPAASEPAPRRGTGTEGRSSPAFSSPAIGENQTFISAYRTAARVAATSSTVLIQGESGTGKELLAHFVHAQSARSARPFVAINCAALPEPLLESELFGHERGSFTGAVARKVGRFERAHGGTLFLDEIAETSLAMQAKLLRVLQERTMERVGGEEMVEVDVRIVAATNRDLEREVAAGRFREDLYYRLAVILLRLPALRERPEDVPLLAEHFLEHFCREHNRSVRGFSADALQRLCAHGWPGNVRQLQNAVERAVLLADGAWLQAEHFQLPAAPSSGPGHAPGGAEGGSGASGPGELLPLEELERRHIHLALALTGGHLARAAEVLGIHRNTLRRKLQNISINGYEDLRESADSIHFATPERAPRESSHSRPLSISWGRHSG